jgi:uncharacterized protein (DUF2237 family)
MVKLYPYKKIIILILSMLSVSLLLIACGTQEVDTNSSGNDSSTSNGEKQTIKLRIGSGYTVEGASWTRVLDEFFVPEVSKNIFVFRLKI